MFGLATMSIFLEHQLLQNLLFKRGSQARDPAAVAHEGTTHHQLFRHVGGCEES